MRSRRSRRTPACASRSKRKARSRSACSPGRSASRKRWSSPWGSRSRNEKNRRMKKLGFIGLGLMGHGMARNLLKKGHALSFVVHRNRSNLADLLDLKAREMKSPAELVKESDVVILCVPGSPQVDAAGDGGMLDGARMLQLV